MGRHIPRFFIDRPISGAGSIELDDSVARHLAQVLRARAGQVLTLFDGTGGEWQATLTHIDRRSATAEIEVFQDIDREAPLKITLAQCISRSERMDTTLQKCTELGVAAIQPLWAQGQKRFDENRLKKRIKHWSGVIQSAAEQSGRTRLPELLPPCSLGEWQPDGTALKIVLAPDADHGIADLALSPYITILVGHEAGLSVLDMQDCKAMEFQPVRLGPRILRTETAGPAVVAGLLALRGDMG